jgi:hypothetical protein
VAVPATKATTAELRQAFGLTEAEAAEVIDTFVRSCDLTDTDGKCRHCGTDVNAMGRDAGGGLHPGKGCNKT